MPNEEALPVAGVVVVMQHVGGGEGHDPETDDQRANRQDPLAYRAVVGSQGRRFADTKNLAANADGHEENAEDESNPDHGPSVVP